MVPPKQFLSILVSRGYLDDEKSHKIEIDAISSGKPIDEYVRSLGTVPPAAVLEAKAECLNVPSINISTVAIDSQAVSLISQQVSRHYTIVPFLLDSRTDTLAVATANPFDITLQDFLEQKTQKKIKFFLAFPDDIAKAITTAYVQSISPEVKKAVQDVNDNKQTTKQQQQQQQSAGVNVAAADAPVAKIVSTILEFAEKSRASDIHIEPEEDQTRVRYRIDGILQNKLILPVAIHDSVISRIKILSGLKLDERRLPQDGRFSINEKEVELDIRVSTLPTVHGEKVVMRLLRKTGGLPTLTDLGLMGVNLKFIQQAITHPYGIVLVTGPTGSGKTTTLYSILSILNKPQVNISTLEDPVEYEMVGINQVQINPTAGLTFANGLRSFLRQDPNIILVGEIRDSETTELASQAALTGHLVFSTLHTNTAAIAIPRLIDLGAEPFIISSVLVCSIAQRIARRICEKCKITYEATPEVGEILGIGRQPVTLYKGQGCDECDHTGYYGRIGIFEVLMVTPRISQMILQHASATDIQNKAVEEGMLTMRHDGFQKALAGITTLEEVIRLTEV